MKNLLFAAMATLVFSALFCSHALAQGCGGGGSCSLNNANAGRQNNPVSQQARLVDQAQPFVFPRAVTEPAKQAPAKTAPAKRATEAPPEPLLDSRVKGINTETALAFGPKRNASVPTIDARERNATMLIASLR